MLILFTPIALIEQKQQQINSAQIEDEKFDQLNIIEKNNNQMQDLLWGNSQEITIEIKDCWEEGDLESQKRYCSSTEKNLYHFE